MVGREQKCHKIVLNHPELTDRKVLFSFGSDVVFHARKGALDFVQDSFASLVQFDKVESFKRKATVSSGKAKIVQSVLLFVCFRSFHIPIQMTNT